MDLSEEMVDCPWCGQCTRLIMVHGHYECMNCHRVVSDCCNGEVADAPSLIT